MPWSAQDIEQLLGRAFRPPQQKRVIMYQLVLAGTSDVFINNVSEDKGVMHRALMNVPLALRTSCLLSFCAVSLTLAVFAERVFDGDIDVIEISDSEADKSGSEKSGTEDGDEDGGDKTEAEGADDDGNSQGKGKGKGKGKAVEHPKAAPDPSAATAALIAVGNIMEVDRSTDGDLVLSTLVIVMGGMP